MKETKTCGQCDQRINDRCSAPESPRYGCVVNVRTPACALAPEDNTQDTRAAEPAADESIKASEVQNDRGSFGPKDTES